jgi:hypothetical protein
MVHRIKLNRKEHKEKARKERREDNSFVTFEHNFALFVIKMDSNYTS